MPRPTFIGICSPAPQSGKSTIAEYLVHRHGYVRVPFAETLKNMVRSLLYDMDYTAEQIAALEAGDKKGKFCDFSDVTLRTVYQTLGTDWGRNMISPCLWTRIWERKALRIARDGLATGVVVDDVRFADELSTVARIGGQVWCVRRPYAEKGTTHVSEAFPFSEEQFDHSFVNSSTLLALHRSIDEALVS